MRGPEMEPPIAEEPEREHSPEEETRETERRKPHGLELEEVTLSQEDEQEMHKLLNTLGKEVSYYSEVSTYKQAIEAGDRSILDENFQDERRAESKDIRSETNSAEQEELVNIFYDQLLEYPIREAERERRASRKEELQEKRRSGGLSSQENAELRELSEEDAKLNMENVELGNALSAFLIRHGKNNPDLAEALWKQVAQIITDKEQREQFRSAVVGPAAIYHMTEGRAPERFEFRFADPEDDVYHGIDVYIEDKETGVVYPVQAKYHRRYDVHETDDPQDASFMSVSSQEHTYTHSSNKEAARKLPPYFRHYTSDITKFQKGTKAVRERDAETQFGNGIFAVLPGQVGRQGTKPAEAIDDTTGQPRETFMTWAVPAFA